MAYNLQSLITILEQISNPEQTLWILDDHSKPQLQSLLQKAASLKQLLEKSSFPKLQTLESQIREAAHKAEDIIESHIVDLMLSKPFQSPYTLSPPDLQQLIQQLDSAMEQVVEGKTMSSGSSSTSTGASPSHDLGSESAVVGLDAAMIKLKDRLTGTKTKLEIVPIVGMGGIGKTTLARNLYQDPDIVSHFKYLAWTTISQDHNMKAILSSLLRCLLGKEFDDKHIEKESDELKDILYKCLYGKRYMIVLDDIWNAKSWDEIRMYFPNNNNRSRIVITTRESGVANYVDSQSLQHKVRLLRMSESWNLLRQTVFGGGDCPDVLQGIGAKIASDCGGLPLAINVIGGVLSKLERSEEVWEHIGIDVRAAIADSDEHFSNILSLSYNHLSDHLKPCFLYMGAFPEDYEIKASRLVRMWVAEGFLKSNGDRCLEEVAEDYLKSLVERNLLLVRDYKSNGKPKRYSIHDLLRDLCMRKAKEEKFLHVMNSPEVAFSKARRVSVHRSDSYEMEDVYPSEELMPLTRTYLSTADELLSPALFSLRLLRVLDIMEMDFQEFPTPIFKLVNLRYLAFSYNSSVPWGLSRLSNLQTLIAKLRMPNLSSDIWEMFELRHLELDGIIWIEDVSAIQFVKKNLQTLSIVCITPLVLEKGFFESIPNIKKLGIDCDHFPSTAVDLSRLQKLETLSLSCFAGRKKEASHFLLRVNFSHTLRKLNVTSCVIFPEVLTTLCALPNLEVLNVHKCVLGSEEAEEKCEEWNAEDGDVFRSLQFLHLDRLNLVHWRADETNFPKLRHLVLKECLKLKEVPSGIGEILTLELIEMYKCSTSAADSAKQIQKVQQSDYDNYSIRLRIR